MLLNKNKPLCLFVLLLWGFALSAYTNWSAYAETPKRVITIGGPITEIAYKLGANGLLVGSDTTSYYPPEAKKLAKVGYNRALSAEGILSLNADLVVLTEDAGPPAAINQLNAAGVPMLQLKTNRSIDDIVASIKQIGQALDREKESKQLIADLTQKQRNLESLLDDMKYRPRVLVVHRHMGGAPLAAGTGTAANSIIALSGGVNVVTEFANYKPLTPEAAAVFQPELIIIAAPPDDAVRGQAKLKTHPVFEQTPAGKNGHIYVMDALEVLGFGPRIIDTAVKLNQLYLNL